MEILPKQPKGFVRGKGLTVEDIEFREIKGEEYVYVTKEEIGQAVEAIVPGVVRCLEVLDFPCQHALGLTTPLNTSALFTL